MKKPLIYHLHGAEFMIFYQDESGKLKKNLIRFVLKKATVIIALSQQWRCNLLSIDGSLPIRVLTNAIAIPELKKKNGKKNIKTILFMGRLGKRKGVPEILTSAEKLKQLHFDFRLILCGDGDISFWQAECNKRNLKDIVQIRSWVSGQEKELLFREADIYVLPTYNEGLPMSVLEAISYGLPVVTTPVGGIPEAVLDGVNGFLVMPGDVHSLSEKVYTLLENDSLRRQFGEASRKLAEEQFDISVISKKLNNLYLKLMIQH